MRSKSDHRLVAANRDVLHKIGVTGGDVARRIANAKLDPTFLMADAEIVATNTLYNINRSKLENLIHRVFDAARLDIKIKDRFGNPVVPRELFLVPRFVVMRWSNESGPGRSPSICMIPPLPRFGGSGIER